MEGCPGTCKRRKEPSLEEDGIVKRQNSTKEVVNSLSWVGGGGREQRPGAWRKDKRDTLGNYHLLTVLIVHSSARLKKQEWR